MSIPNDAAPAQPIADPIAPATAPAPAVDERTPLERLSREDRQKFWDTGELPKAPAADPDDEPAPAATTPAPKADAAAVAPEPTGIEASENWKKFVKSATPQGLSKRQHLINEMARHTAEHEQRARTLETELDAMRRRQAETGPRKEAAAEPPPDYDGNDPSDPYPEALDAFADDADPYAAMIIARFKWEQRKEQRVAQRNQQRTTADRAAQEREQAFTDRAHKFAQDHPDFKAKTEQVRAQIDPRSEMAAWLMDSPLSAQMLDHLADHPEEFRRIAQPEGSFRSREEAMNASYRAFVRLETRLEPSTPASSTTPPADAPAQAPTPKLLSSAPPPPRTLGERPAAPADEIAAAVARKDFRAFAAEADKRALARAKTGL